jgi:hypothetical protein
MQLRFSPPDAHGIVVAYDDTGELLVATLHEEDGRWWARFGPGLQEVRDFDTQEQAQQWLIEQPLP